ncbi:hypothetical protein SAMN04487989_10244 [Bizionia echini]|uniref:DUF1566 domain-containing protein n=1 Tax=Bizionia echini TaxID=649333 RepID=A0A1I5AGU4_9FLAO|nr:hypothetical protein [Bizionia echini]SFN61657.1 hypothetical protein SAMN04487989_10244 [Bizionia echini]
MKFQKKIKQLVLFNMLFWVSIAFSQTPQKMSYQAIIRSSDGTLVTNQSIGMQISILAGSINGSAVYTETQSATTNINGLVSLEIGTGSTSDDFSAIDWSSGTFFIKTESDITGGNNYSITGTNQLLSVPYALHAANGVKKYAIGDYAHGGIVFYVDPSGEHGLVVSLQNVSNAMKWWPEGTNIRTGVQFSGIFDGASNTQMIYTILGYLNDDNYAAKACLGYSTGYDGLPVSGSNAPAYGDWYLPTTNELSLLFASETLINSELSSHGGQVLGSGFYWSSVETYVPYAYAAFVWDNYAKRIEFQNKLDERIVRAIRRF